MEVQNDWIIVSRECVDNFADACHEMKIDDHNDFGIALDGCRDQIVQESNINLNNEYFSSSQQINHLTKKKFRINECLFEEKMVDDYDPRIEYAQMIMNPNTTFNNSVLIKNKEDWVPKKIHNKVANVVDTFCYYVPKLW